MTFYRPHGKDLLHQVPSSGQRTVGVLVLRFHSQTVEPGQRRGGQASHGSSRTGDRLIRPYCQSLNLNVDFNRSEASLCVRSLAWPGALMGNSWLRCVKTVKSASMTPVSLLHHCRYETGLFHLIYNINSDNKKFLELNFFFKKHISAFSLLIESNWLFYLPGGSRSRGPPRSSCGVGVWGEVPAGVRVWQVRIFVTRLLPSIHIFPLAGHTLKPCNVKQFLI